MESEAGRCARQDRDGKAGTFAAVTARTKVASAAARIELPALPNVGFSSMRIPVGQRQGPHEGGA
jgi:hypothetical protein